MLNRIILLSGPIYAGKSTLANGLAERYKMCVLKTSQILMKKVREDLRQNRKALQFEGELLDKKTRGQWVLEELRK